MNTSVLIATSLDGFIARTNGAIDWLPPGGGEEHGYDAFIATGDALVIGRNTFGTVLSVGTWPYTKPVFVLTTRSLPVPTPAGAVVERMSGDPARHRVAARDAGHAAYLRGWRDHYPAVSAAGAHPAPHHRPSSGAPGRWGPALWRATERCRAATCRHAPVREWARSKCCLLYTSPSPRDLSTCRMPSSA